MSPCPSKRPSKLRRHRTTIAGLETSWLEAGPVSGPPVLLMHGGGVDNAQLSWSQVIGPLAEAGHRVIAVDMPGYGATQGFGRPHGIADFAPWCAGLLDSVIQKPAILVGNSLGGGTALQVALTHPNKVRALVPCCSYGLAPAPPVGPAYWVYAQSPMGRFFPWSVTRFAGARRAGGAVLLKRRAKGPDLWPWFDAEARRQAHEFSFHNFLRHEVRATGFRTCLLPDLPKLTQPTLYIHGRQDPAIPAKHARRAQARTPGAALALLDTGHWPMRKDPSAFCAALLPWIAALPPQG